VLADQIDSKPKELFTKVTVPPMIFALIAIIAFALTLRRATNLPTIPTALAPSKDSQKMYTAVLLDDVANMEPARLLAAGQIDEAIGEANKEMQEKPNDLETIMCVGNVLSEKGDKQRGIDLLKQTVVLAPNSRYVRLNYARHLPLAGRSDEAMKEYEFLCKTFPKLWLDPRIELAAIYVQRGKAPEAAALQKTILEVEPDNTAVKRDYYLSQARTGQEDEGLKALPNFARSRKNNNCIQRIAARFSKQATTYLEKRSAN
jgi:Flp pilus assembly protein TadD